MGIYLLNNTLMIRRMRIYRDLIPNPVLLGRRNIPLTEIEKVTVNILDKEKVRVQLFMKEDSNSTQDKSSPLGQFLEEDIPDLMDGFRKVGIDVGYG